MSSLIQEHLRSRFYNPVEWLGLGCRAFESAVFWLGLQHGDQRPPGLALFLFWVECEFLQLVKGADSVSAEHMLTRKAQALGNFSLAIMLRQK